MDLRKATLAEIPIIQSLVHKIWPIAYSEILTAAQLEYMLDKFYATESLSKQFASGHTFLLLSDEEQDIGFAAYNAINPTTYKLQKLYVLTQQQGKGSGRFIIDHIISSIQSIGATHLQLNVNRHNKARSFYEKLGFKVIKEEDIAIGSGYFMNDYVMEKKLDKENADGFMIF